MKPDSADADPVPEPVVPLGPAPLRGKVAILPFADHTTGSPVFSEPGFEKRNLLVFEAVHEAFALHGFMPVGEEGSTRFLLDHAVLKTVTEAELKDIVLAPSVGKSSGRSGGEPAVRKAPSGNAAAGKVDTENFSAMGDSELKTIGQQFGADYIIRGRIVEVTPERYTSIPQANMKVLPFALALEKGTAFAVSQAEAYEAVDAEIAGSFLTRTLPPGVEPTENDSPTAFLWGKGAHDIPVPLEVTGKARAGLLLQVTLLAQDAETGQIIWMKRATVETPPMAERKETVEQDRYTRAVEALAGSLAEDFSKNVNPSSRAIKAGPT